MKTGTITIISALLILAVSGAASAQQISNTPYSPGANRPNVGISSAYRQAILNAEIRGQYPSALVRGPSGELLTIQRTGNNALIRAPGDSNFIPGARPNAAWPTGLGTGLGWNLISFSGNGYLAATTQSLDTWISMVPSGTDGETLRFGLYRGGGDTPINAWIGQLDLI